ncbi:putative 2OG-Fe(II) oxygenase [Actinomadura macra]|uniref:putative 2OG-Fe(II) oxygenase n=1 Tax=Actinomadura macra TaxID=46164 RepID=UPI00082EC067|nr:putative 2OG-Fe(II) oxygenase [Actinomadura macra]
MTQTHPAHDTDTRGDPPGERLVLQLWRTPVYQADCTSAVQHLPSLRELILDADKTDDPPGAVNAVKSSQTMLTWEHPSIDWLSHQISVAGRTLARAVLGEAADAIDEHHIVTEAWAVICRPGEPLRPHTRHDSAWSGLLSVAADPDGDPDGDGGRLHMLDPRPAAVTRAASPGAVRYCPVPGRMIAFPGWQAHWMKATTNHSRLRIAIAWNITYHQDRGWTP